MINLIKNIFLDIFVLYKNFLHFNLSKLINIIVSILYTLIFIVPLIVIMNLFVEYVMNSWNTSDLYKNIYYLIEWIIFFTAFIAIWYYFVLQTNLNLNYINDKKLPLLKNNYFNLKLLKNYFKLMILNIFAFTVLYIIYQLLFWILVFSIWGMDKILEFSNIISIVVWLFGIITFGSFFYLLYIMLLSIIVLVDESNWKTFESSFYYFKKAFILAKWWGKNFKLLIVLLLTFIISLSIYIPLFNSIFLSSDLKNYIEYKVNPESFWEEEFYYIEDLKWNFGWYTIVELEKSLQKIQYFKLVMQILFFLFTIGVLEMILVSFYKRELLWNKKDKKNDSVELKGESVEIKKVVKRKAPIRKIATKTPIKKTAEKKVLVKKTTTRKTMAKTTAAKTTTKAPVKNTTTKKVVAKKTPVKRVEVKKTTLSKTPVKKVVTKVPTKKVPVKKVTTRKTTTRKTEK